MPAFNDDRKRRVLRIAAAILVMAGCVSLLVILVASMRPSAPSLTLAPSVKLPPLPPRSFAFVFDPMTLDNSPSQLLILRTNSNELRVWRIPTMEGVAMLPDVHWWQHGPTCKEFVPNFVTERISCLDPSIGAWGREPYIWRLDGVNVSTGRKVDDLMNVEGREENGSYVLSSRGIIR